MHGLHRGMAVLCSPGVREFVSRTIRLNPSATDRRGFMVAVYDDPSNPDDGRKGVVYVMNADIEVGGPLLPERGRQ